MRHIAKYFALLMLLALIAPSILYLTGKMVLPTAKTIMLLATILWFASATAWMWKEQGK
jgi:hypothetical protein